MRLSGQGWPVSHHFPCESACACFFLSLFFVVCIFNSSSVVSSLSGLGWNTLSGERTFHARKRLTSSPYPFSSGGRRLGLQLKLYTTDASNDLGREVSLTARCVFLSVLLKKTGRKWWCRLAHFVRTFSELDLVALLYKKEKTIEVFQA